MARRTTLPQLAGGLFLTDGGLETTLVFHEGIELPSFAAFDLLRRPGGREQLRDYYLRYARIAEEHATGFVLESATWRASPEWGGKLGYDLAALRKANLDAIELCREVQHALAANVPSVISGCIGPRGDGYAIASKQTIGEAERYHAHQAEWFAESQVDLITAVTMNYVEEAIGIARAARAVDVPVAISFTVETDGRLPSGQTLADAIDQLDAETDGYAAYCMLNCAHPTHFQDVLARGGRYVERLRGLRANASRRSHKELDEATELDAGNPEELGGEYASLRARFPQLAVLGGCCGTDHRHVAAIAQQCG